MNMVQSVEWWIKEYEKEKTRADSIETDLKSARLIPCPACDGECQCTAQAMAEHRRDWKERCDRIATQRDVAEKDLISARREIINSNRVLACLVRKMGGEVSIYPDEQRTIDHMTIETSCNVDSSLRIKVQTALVTDETIK